MKILNYYKSKSVLICTSDRFFREVLLDKFIRLIPDIGTIYLLMEPYDNFKTPDQLYKKMFSSKCFKRAKHTNQYFDEYVANRVKVLLCDFQKEDLGISSQDTETLLENVNLIVSYMDLGSTISKLYQMIDVNIYTPLYLMTLAKRMKHIENFVHVSSITSLYHAPGGGEKIYDNDYETDGHVKRHYILSKGMKSEKGVLPTYPHNYVYTKRSCEILLDKYKSNVPLTILRPGFIGACWKDPFPGWVTNSKGMAVIFTLVGLGELELILANPDRKYMELPADALCDYIISSGAICCKLKETRVINLPGGIRNFTCKDAYKVVLDYWNKHDLRQRVGPIKLEICNSETLFQSKIQTKRINEAKKWREKAGQFSNLALMKQAENLLKKAKRETRIANNLKFIVYDEWPKIETGNMGKLIEQMDEFEKEEFLVELDKIDYPAYLTNCCEGIRKYLLKGVQNTHKTKASDVIMPKL